MSRAETGQAKADVGKSLGLYVHVPFCSSTCDFCGFYQIRPTAEAVNRFLDGVERECGLVEWPRPVTTVFWGGGTPGLLAPAALRRLGRSLISTFGGQPPEEWTVELAPASVTESRLDVLRELGVTRVSLGVQSFRPDILDRLGRRHSRAQIDRAWTRLRAAEFASVNLDLMFALPDQSDEDWLEDVRTAADLGPDHLSTYCLTFEEDTALWVKLAQGRLKIDPEREIRLYEKTWQELDRLGYHQYEISNFARPGHACRHNLHTWRMGEWIGLGPAAASQQGGWRGTNAADLEAWHAAVNRGERLTAERTPLTPGRLAEDALIFGLRMNVGVDLAEWRARGPEAPWEEVDALLDRLVDEGLAELEGERVRLTPRGRLLADAVGSEIMGAFSKESATA